MTKLYIGMRLLTKDEFLRFILVILISILSAGSSVFSFMILFEFLNYLQDNQNLGPILKMVQSHLNFEKFELQLSIFSLCVGSLFLLTAIFLIVRSYVTNSFSISLIYSLSKRSLEIALNQSYKSFAEKSTGKLSALILSETELLVHKYYRPIVNATASFFFSIILIIFLSILSFKMTVSITISLATCYLSILFFLKSSLLLRGAKRKVANEERYKLVNEALIGIKTVKIFNLESKVNISYAKLTRNMVRQIVHSVMLSEIPSYIMQGLLFGGAFLVLALFAQFIDIQLFFANNVTTLVVFAGVMLRLLPEFQRMYNGLSNATFSMESIDAFAAFLSKNNLVSIEEGLEPIFPLKMELHNVTVKHGENYALRNVNLEIKEGEIVGIVGRSGSGKSTLLDVVMGMIDPTSGDISIGNISLKDINKRQWMQKIGYVPQHIFLMDRTLLENVTLSDAENYNKAKFDQAIRSALLLEFVESRGDEIEVGEAGVKMSGGQVQRAGIARALYRDGKLLVLDEATSSLDIISEQHILKNILNEPRKTTIIVTHRLNALNYCDKIAIMDEGKILHFGPAAEILPLVEEFFNEP